MSALMEAVRAGNTAETLRVVQGMTDAERRACLPGLKALRAELIRLERVLAAARPATSRART